MDLDELARSEKIVAGAGIVQVVDLLFLPWHSIDLGITASTRSAVESPDGALGAAALVLTVVAVGVTLVRARRPATDLPRPPSGWDAAVLAPTVVALVLLVAKLAIDTDALGVGAWLGVALAGAMAYGASTLRNRCAPRNC